MQRVETSPYASDLCSTSRRAPEFDLISWVLDLAGITQRLTQSILDVGCGNGSYECTGEEKASRSTGSGTSETILEASSEQHFDAGRWRRTAPFAAEFPPVYSQTRFVVERCEAHDLGGESDFSR
jgi:hypothetical protein